MNKLFLKLKEISKCMPWKPAIISVLLICGACILTVIISYCSLFVWKISSLMGNSAVNYFSAICSICGFIVLFSVPEVVYEIYMRRRMILLMHNKEMTCEQIVRKYQISFPKYNEFDYSDYHAKYDKYVGMLYTWQVFSTMIYLLTVLWRVSEVDTAVAVLSVVIVVLNFCIMITYLIKQVSHRRRTHSFWQRVGTTPISPEATYAMKEEYTKYSKKTIFKAWNMIIASAFNYLIIMLGLFDIVPIAVVAAVFGVSAVTIILLMIYTSKKTYKADELYEKTVYRFDRD